MDQNEIKRQCRITWAVNFGTFNCSNECGSPAKQVNEDKRSKSSNNRADFESDTQRKYLKSLKCTGGGEKRSFSNDNRIVMGLEAGKTISGIESFGEVVKMWVYLAYKEDSLKRKAKVFNILSCRVADDYVQSRNSERLSYKRVLIASMYQLASMLNQFDKRFPPPSKMIFGYKRPRNFKFRHKQLFYEILQIYLEIEAKAKAGAKV